MSLDSGLYIALLPSFAAGTNVSYRIWSMDSAGNTMYSSSDLYVVQSSTTTTTTTTTSTTTTTGTSTTTTSTTTPPATLPDSSLYLAVGFVVAMVIAVILAVRKRRG